MNWFGHKDNDQQENTTCVCKNNAGIFFDKRQLSRITALFLLIGVFIFVGGYFWGQRVATDQLLNVVERDSFADQIYYSMSSMYDLKDDSNEPDEVGGESEEQTEQSTEPLVAQNCAKEDKPELATTTYSSANSTKAPHESGNKKRYVAQLCSFGYERPAKQLVERLRSKGVTVVCQKRQSKTAQGKASAWYQVVTPRFNDKKSLQVAIDKIKKHEKLHDVRVVEVGVG